MNIKTFQNNLNLALVLCNSAYITMEGESDTEKDEIYYL